MPDDLKQAPQPTDPSDQAEPRSAAFSPPDTDGRPLEKDSSEEDEELARRREVLSDLSDTSGGQMSERVGLPYNGKGDVQLGVEKEMQARKGKPFRGKS